jgi:hypothetical protein
MVLIHNERVKLLASALNALGVALIVTGVIAPVAGVLYRGTERGAWNDWWFVIGAAWFLAGVGLHSAGQIVLGRVR